MGTLKTVWSFPSGRDQTRAVLSEEAVTTNRFCASVAMRLIPAVCRSVLSRSRGSVGKLSSANTGCVKNAVNRSALIPQQSAVIAKHWAVRGLLHQ